MEVEQFREDVPAGVRNYVMNNSRGSLTDWHRDASGPREISIGPAKNVKAILNRVYEETRDQGHTWDWHASNGSSGAGSHVHLCVARDLFDDHVAAWTIAYNTAVELFPFLAPFFCHNWEDGFRDGTRRRGGQLNVEYWAEGTLTRYSQDTVRERVDHPTRYSRSYNSVTFNPSAGAKPLTIELRANDAHPAMALNGLLLLRRLTGRAIEEGWSPRLENHHQTLRRCYAKIYSRAADVGLLTAMQEPIEGGITFEDDRGLPGDDDRGTSYVNDDGSYDSMWDVLRRIMVQFPQTPGTWRKRAHVLVRSGDDTVGPQNNQDALWHFDADDDAFEWDTPPAECEVADT